MTWNKSGNFSRDIDMRGGTILLHECGYETHQPQPINKIRLLGYVHGNITITVEFPNETQASIFLKKLIAKNLPAETWDYVHKKVISISSEEPNQLSAFLKLVIAEDAHVREILGDICQSLNLSTTLGLTLEGLKTVPFNDALALVLEAQQNKSYDIIYELLGHYWQQSLLPIGQRNVPVNLNDIYSLACAVSADSPHYARAQDHCVEALMRQDMKAAPKEQKEEAVSLDEDEGLLQDDYFQNLEKKFAHALHGTQQELTDRLYNELCGHGLGAVKVHNIEGKAQTLLSLAEQMRILQHAAQKQVEPTARDHRFFSAEEKPITNNVVAIIMPEGMGMD